MTRFSLIVFAAAIVPSAAFADSIAIESYAGQRPADADKLLAPIFDELGGRGFASGRKLERRVASRVSSAPSVLSETRVAEAKKFVSSGSDQFSNGAFDSAVKELQHGLEILDSAPVTLALDQKLRNVRFRGLVFLSLAHGRRGEPAAATRAMAELARSYPDKQVSRAQYGPEARDLYMKVTRELKKQGLGVLHVKVDDGRTVVFVNERYAGVGKVPLRDLPSGRYRVFVQQGDVRGRLHTVDVAPGSEATVNVTWRAESTLRTDETHVSFSFADEAGRSKSENGESVRLARLINASSVIVLGIRDYNGQRSIVGSYLAVDSSKPIHTAAIAVDPVVPSEDKLRAMARFLAGDEAARKLFPNLVDQGGGSDRVPVGPRRDVGRPYRTLKWIGVVGGMAAIGTGIALILLHEDEVAGTMRQPDGANTKTAGIITTAVGGAITLAGVYFWIRDSKDAKRQRMSVAPTPGGAMLTFAGSF